MDNSSHLSSSAQQRKAIIAKLKASGLAKGKTTDEGSSGEDQEYNFEKLKTFHIPRKKEQSDGKDLLTELPLHSREYMHTLYPAIKSSFLYPQSSRHIRIQKVELVNNQNLLKEYLDKKKDMKDDGRSEKELSESYAFVHISNKSEVTKICENGIKVGNTSLVSLGKPDMGVYVCKHADVVSLAPLSASDTGHILVFKVVKGKAKVVTECRGSVTTQEPTPLYDCHITKFSGEGSKGNHPRAYQALQYYIYEYGELDLVERPRQILPYAVLQYSCCDSVKALQRRDSFPMADQASMDMEQSKLPLPTAGVGIRAFCLWKGKLLVKGGSFCNVEMRTDNDSAGNKAFLDNSINVKTLLSVTNFSRQLPPTLLNKSGRKHNVVYRGRNYNIFTLTPSDESGYGKFRQLIAHLVQKEAIAVVPLRMASCLYLIPHSNLTVNKMGITPLPSDGDKPNTQFLHVLIVTPKYLSTKVNDQKNYNVITVRRRRDNQSESRVSEELDQKLRSMNIETSSAVSALQPDQHEKLLKALKDKKRIQNSEKLLHNHYKEATSYFSSKLSYTKFTDNVKNLWNTTCQTRLDYYKPKEKVLQPQKSILKSDTSSLENTSMKKSSRPTFQDTAMDIDAEATFSDEDEGMDLKSHSARSKSAVSVQSYQLEKRKTEAEKRKAPLEIDSKSTPPIKMSRPSFKALVEVILTASIEELMLHPDFVFSERFEKTHRVSKGAGFTQAFDLEQEDQISVQFRQQIPFAFVKDCPYAYENNSVVKSMLRALYGTWEEDLDASNENKQKEFDKVNWVRDVLHKNKNLLTTSQHTVSTNDNDRSVSDETTNAVSKESPLAAGSSSADSGFASSSTTTTPNAAAAPQTSSASSFQDIANLLASALQGKPTPTPDTPASTGDETDVQTTTQNIIQALVKSVNESGLEIPDELKDIMDELSMTSDQTGNNDTGTEDTGIPVESSPEPGLLSSSSSNATPSMDVSGSNEDAANHYNQPLQRQDPRMMKTPRSLRRLPLPNYRFPPSERATELLPKDEEAARNLRPLTKRSEQETTNRIGTNIQTLRTPGMNAPTIHGMQTKPTSAISPTNRITGLGPRPEGYRQNLMIGGTKSEIGMNTSRFRGPDRLLTSTESGSSSSDTKLRSQIDLLLRRRRSSDPQNTLKGEKNIGNISTTELTSILRHLGIRPAFNPGALSIQGIVPHQSPGILKGASGPSPGILGKSGSPGGKSSGQVIRIIDNRRVLVDSTDSNAASLDSEKSSSIVSNKIPVVIPERFALSEKKRAPENFMIVKPVSAVHKKLEESTQSASAATDLAMLEPDVAPKDSAAQAQDIFVSAHTAEDTAVAYQQETKNEVDTTSASAVTAITNPSKPDETASGSPVQTKSDLSFTKQLPESYIQQIHKKFKQQQLRKEKESLTDSTETQIQIALPVSKPTTASNTKGSQPCVTPDNKSGSEIISTTKLITTPQHTDSTPSEPPKSEVSTDVQDGAEAPTVHPTKSAVLSELGTLITNVQSAKLGQTSADELSSRLLELAMQLRKDTDSSETSTSDVKSSNKKDDLTPPPLPPDTVGSGELTFAFKQADVSPTDTSSNLEEVSMEIECTDTVRVLDNSIHAPSQPSLAPQPQYHTESEISHPSASDSTLAEEQLDEVAAKPLNESKSDSYYKDDGEFMTAEAKVFNSFLESYKSFSPLSGFIRREIRLSSKIEDVLARVDQGSASRKSSETPEQAITVALPQNAPSRTESEKDQSSSTETPEEEQSFKTQKIAHVKPQPSASRSCPSFYVFNPRNDPECVRISLLLTLSGKPFPIQNVAEAIETSSTNDDTLVQVTKEMIDRSLNDEEVWIIIRSADIELMPALPFLSLLKCAGPKVNFIQADSAADVNARKYINIMSGEFGILIPVSVQVLTSNIVAVVEMLAWMMTLNRKKDESLWRLALPKHIIKQLGEYRDSPDVNDTLKIASHSLLDVIKSHAEVIIDVVGPEEQAGIWSTTDIFDVAISLQMRCIDLTRHVVVLTEEEEADQRWNTHRRAGLAVTTVPQFVQAIMDNKREKARGESFDVYSPLTKIYKVEK